MAIANAASEVIWLIRLLKDLGLTDFPPVTVHCDNHLLSTLPKTLFSLRGLNI